MLWGEQEAAGGTASTCPRVRWGLMLKPRTGKEGKKEWPPACGLEGKSKHKMEGTGGKENPVSRVNLA